MAVSLLVLFGWSYIQEKYFPLPKPQQAATAPSTTQTVDAATAPTTAPATQGIAALVAPMATTGLRALPAPEPQTVALGSAELDAQDYRIGLRINTQGAGLDSVTLNQFTRAVKEKSPFVYQTPYPQLPETRPLATRSVNINGTSVDLATVNWQLISQSRDSAAFSVDIVNEAGPVARIHKTYTLSNYAQTKDTSGGYLVDVNLAIENLTSQPLTASATINGPSDPPRDIDRAGDRQIISGYIVDGIMKVQHLPLESFTESAIEHDLTHYEAKPEAPVASWIGTSNVYFNAILRPARVEERTLKPAQAVKFHSRAARLFADAADNQIALTIQTADLPIAPGEKLQIPFEAAFTPRLRNLLKNDHYAALPLGYDQTLVLSSGPCAICTFPVLVDGLVYLLNFFHMIVRDWGLAIIMLVILVRVILHPITKKAQVNMMKMGKLGPEIERLKKKYGDNKDELSKAQMQLYKQMGFTPVLGCLPLFLQMPIFIALFMSLQTTFELRHAPFLYGYTWIKDLAQPDALIPFKHAIDLWFFKINAFNLLPILVAVVQYFSFKYTPRPPATSPEQEQQQKMMQWMTLIFPLLFYKMPSGLNLYYLTSTGLGILEGKITRDHIKKQEELEKALGPVIIDAPVGKRKGKELAKEPAKKKGGLAGLWQQIQEQAEQVRREAEKKKQG